MELLLESAYPFLFRVADASARQHQRRLLTVTGLRLSVLLAATVLGAVSVNVARLDLAALGAAAALGTALVIEVYLLTYRPDLHWYESRAAAESAKTLAWRYAVAGQPFALGTHDQEQAEALLLQRLSMITNRLDTLVQSDDTGAAYQITDEMRRLRAESLDERRRAYMVGRIEDQRHWYGRRSRQHGQSAARWSVLMASMEALGLIAAILNSVGVLNVDLPGIASAIAAGALAWLQTRQHHQLAGAYAIAAQELGEIASRIEWPNTEDEWAHFVDEVEEAISREHTLWWASHV